MRNHRPVQPGHATGGSGGGRRKKKRTRKKKKKGRKGKGRISEICVYICVYIYMYVCIHIERSSVRSSFRSPHVVCPVRSSFEAGGGREHRESFSGPCFYDNEQNWRTCALVSTDNKVHLCNQRLLGGGAGALKRPQHE